MDSWLAAAAVVCTVADDSAPRVRATIPAEDAPPLPDLVGRRFDPGAPDVAWVGDITYIATGEGWLYNTRRRHSSVGYVPPPRAGERGAAPRRGVSVPGELAERMMFPLVRELAVDGIPVTVTCRVLKLCRQQYYRWIDEPFTTAELDEAWLANAIFDAHRDDPEFGYRFLADEVRLDGTVVSDRVVWRICRDNGWWSVFAEPKRAKGSKPGAPSHDDLVRRNFTAEAPNVVWLADITEHWTDEGKLYCGAIKHLFSNRIVGWAIDSRMKARLVVAATEMAVARRGGDVAGCILHSDRGSQFRSRNVHRTLARHGTVGSMGKVGSAGDNAAMESFFAPL